MIHTYRLHGFAPGDGLLRWSCRDCPRVVDQDRRTGAVMVIYAGAESCTHGGRSGHLHIFDQPELGAFEAGVWAGAIEGMEF